ncbi:Cytochrome c2 [Rhodovulum sp. P5]|uniref:c-type cytochrome n=1 Tax=Rhodovulum sp. P5 TaxID=1564506 RepID=UPI0009C328BA|nr:cytochrome c family protein [Rhodovulum sp. P5]ARE39400.1 Cytochrome c2 [Rhodovulum sp. P5]
MSTIKALVKAIGAFAAALAVFLVLSMASDGLFSNRGLEEPAYVIAGKDDAPAEPEQNLTFEERLAMADPAAGERVFKECKTCHRIEEGVNMVGPSLYNVVGRPVASISGFKYSGALDGTAEVWTPEAIDAFITDPRGYAPGTAMSFQGLRKAQDRANVIAYLKQAGS